MKNIVEVLCEDISGEVLSFLSSTDQFVLGKKIAPDLTELLKSNPEIFEKEKIYHLPEDVLMAYLEVDDMKNAEKQANKHVFTKKSFYISSRLLNSTANMENKVKIANILNCNDNINYIDLHKALIISKENREYLKKTKVKTKSNFLNNFMNCTIESLNFDEIDKEIIDFIDCGYSLANFIGSTDEKIWSKAINFVGPGIINLEEIAERGYISQVKAIIDKHGIPIYSDNPKIEERIKIRESYNRGKSSDISLGIFPTKISKIRKYSLDTGYAIQGVFNRNVHPAFLRSILFEARNGIESHSINSTLLEYNIEEKSLIIFVQKIYELISEIKKKNISLEKKIKVPKMEICPYYARIIGKDNLAKVIGYPKTNEEKARIMIDTLKCVICDEYVRDNFRKVIYNIRYLFEEISEDKELSFLIIESIGDIIEKSSYFAESNKMMMSIIGTAFKYLA